MTQYVRILTQLGQMKVCMVSLDVEKDIGESETFYGVERLDRILEVFDEFESKATLFATGEVLERYPRLVQKWSEKHEIACHGYHHVPLFELSFSEREKQLEDFGGLYGKILGQKPKGFRAVKHTIDNTQLGLLEGFGFLYDSSVMPRYVAFRKYVGYKGKAPTEPYHPSCDDCRKKGRMKILEIPTTPLVFGISLYGTWLRVLGPRFYEILLTLKKPKFISLVAHPWDAIKYQGSFSRNSGDRFLEYLERLLGDLRSQGYIFMSGEEVLSNLEENRLS